MNGLQYFHEVDGADVDKEHLGHGGLGRRVSRCRLGVNLRMVVERCVPPVRVCSSSMTTLLYMGTVVLR